MSGRLTTIGVSCLVLAWAIPAVAQDSDAERFWGQWRGPDANGVARHGNPPTEWSETQNIRWKVALPGSGHSTPLVWGDRVFVTTALPYGDRVEPRPETAPGAHDNAPVAGAGAVGAAAVARGRSGCTSLP